MKRGEKEEKVWKIVCLSYHFSSTQITCIEGSDNKDPPTPQVKYLVHLIIRSTCPNYELIHRILNVALLFIIGSEEDLVSDNNKKPPLENEVSLSAFAGRFIALSLKYFYPEHMSAKSPLRFTEFLY